MSKRMNKDVRKQDIIDISLKLSEKLGYMNVYRHHIAEVGQFSPSLVHYHFKTMNQLRRQIIRAAIEQENLSVIAQGLVNKDKHALKAPKELQKRASLSLTN